MIDLAKDLLGLKAVVTGSSTGIGRATALAFAERGAQVVVHGRTLSLDLQHTIDMIAANGGHATAVACDLSNGQQIETWIDRCWSELGEVHAWVNNAGCDVLTGEAANWSFDEKLEQLWRLDVRATLSISRKVAARMQAESKRANVEHPHLAGNRSVTLIGWDQAWQGMAGDSGQMFGTIKGAVMSMTGHLAHSYAPEVRVNCVAPGWIQTQWGSHAPEYWRQRAVSESLMNCWGQPADVAHAIVNLSAPTSRFISGQVISVNGGFRFGGSLPVNNQV